MLGMNSQMAKGLEEVEWSNTNISSIGLNSTIMINDYTINFTQLFIDVDHVSIENLTYIHPQSCPGYRTNITLFNLTIANNITELPSDSCTDNEPPLFFNVSEFPPNGTNVSLSHQPFEFNVTWIDYNQTDHVWIEFDGANYTNEVYNISDAYFFNRTRLGKGEHNYTWWANDTSNNVNNTGMRTYYANTTSIWEIAVIIAIAGTIIGSWYSWGMLDEDKKKAA